MDINKKLLIIALLTIFSCKETRNDKLINKIKIGQKRQDVISDIGKPNSTYISANSNIVDTYYNQKQDDAPLIITYQLKDSIMINTLIDW